MARVKNVYVRTSSGLPRATRATVHSTGGRARASPAKPKAKRRQYSSRRLDTAKTDVLAGKTPHEAAAKRKVPRMTIVRSLARPTEPPLGRRPVLPPEAEAELVKYLKMAAVQGFPVSVKELREMVYLFCETNKITHPFNHNEQAAGKKWWMCFKRRHPEITLRKPENLSRARALGMNREIVGEWFETLGKVISDAGVETLPELIWNVDESGLVTVPNSTGKVVSFKELRNQPQIVTQERGVLTTLISACSASGAYIPSMLAFKAKKKRPELANAAPPGTAIRISDSGWSNRQMFLEFMQHFVEHAPPIPAGKKLVLILDGHGSHATLDVIKLCHLNNIELLCLPAHTSNYLQPLDRSVFGPFKKAWYDECRKHIRHRRGDSGIGNITQADVARLYSKAWAKAALPENAVSGFRAAGVSPFDPSAVPDEAFATSDAVVDFNENIDPAQENASPSESETPLNDNEAATPPIEHDIPSTPPPQFDLETDYGTDAYMPNSDQSATPLLHNEAHSAPSTSEQTVHYAAVDGYETAELSVHGLERELSLAEILGGSMADDGPVYHEMSLSTSLGAEIEVASSSAAGSSVTNSVANMMSFPQMFPEHFSPTIAVTPKIRKRKKAEMHLTKRPIPNANPDSSNTAGNLANAVVNPCCSNGASSYTLSDYDPCPVCKQVEKGSDEWIRCRYCKVWQHETCEGKSLEDIFICIKCYAT